MQIAEENTLVEMIRNSLLDGQDGIKIRAFLAFNRENPLATAENLENLKEKGAIVIHDDTLYPLETLE